MNIYSKLSSNSLASSSLSLSIFLGGENTTLAIILKGYSKKSATKDDDGKFHMRIIGAGTSNHNQQE